MLPLLEAIAKACHSYGWSIVILTMAVRLAVYPLVASSTRSMQRMSQLQPKLKVIQDRYKDNPELFQKKAMEFYKKNQINPMGGCLPMLVQLPILWALFATFTGPPFGDKIIPVKVKVVTQAQASQVQHKEVSGGTSAYVWKNGKTAKVIVFPGDSTVVAGSTIDFGVRAVDGTLPPDFAPVWKISGAKPLQTNGAKIDDKGVATFPEATDNQELTVNAIVPGVAKNERFGFISGLGKVSKGMDLLKPENWDNLVLIALFGASMFLSQKLMVQPPAPGADPEQLLIQKQTQRTMPIAVTAMFFFVPLPSGVFLYMVVSNMIQSLQTWLVMRSPAPAIVDVHEGEGGPVLEAEVIDSTSAAKQIESNGSGNTKNPPKKKKSKKK
jgi:YidC/Oxa1 family membrane protein insertase